MHFQNTRTFLPAEGAVAQEPERESVLQAEEELAVASLWPPSSAPPAGSATGRDRRRCTPAGRGRTSALVGTTAPRCQSPPACTRLPLCPKHHPMLRGDPSRPSHVLSPLAKAGEEAG